MELAGYVAVVRRWWTTLLIATWVAGLAGYLIASGVQPTYEGVTRLLVGPVVGDVDTVRAAGALSYTYSALATSDPALEAVHDAVGLPEDATIVARAIPDETTRIIQIRAEYGDPEVAAAIANAVAENLVAKEPSGVELPEGNLTVIETAVPNPDPIAPQVTLIAIVAAGTGLLAAAVLVLLVEYFGNTINSRGELTQIARVPLLGFASLGQRFRPTERMPTIVEARPESRGASSVRLIATKVAYARPGQPASSILVVGAAAHDGSADLALAIGTVLTRAGRRVAVVDANEAGDLSDLAGVNGRTGVAELLDNPKIPMGEVAVMRPQRPSVIGRGLASRIELVDPDAVRGVVDRLSREFDLVLVTAAPIHLSGNALVWAQSVNSVLLAAERDRAKRDDVAYAVDNLMAVNAPLTGTVLLDHAPRRRGGRQAREQAADRARASGGLAQPGSVARRTAAGRSDDLGR